MEYLHSQGMIQCDLKLENLLFTADMCLKVVDFGIACEEINCDYVNEDRGTYRWMALEVINHRPHNRKVDVYNFGIVLWEIIMGRAPYEDITLVRAPFALVHEGQNICCCKDRLHSYWIDIERNVRFNLRK